MVLVVKNLPANAGDARAVGSIPGEGNGNPLRYSCLGNPMDREAWWVQSMGLQKSQTAEHTQLLSALEEPDPAPS